MNVREKFIILSVVVTIAIISIAQFWPPAWWSFIIFGPFILMGIIDMIQKKQTIRRNFPLIGRMRYLLESVRPEIMQYFVETDTQGRPINRIFRTLIYQRSKKVNDTTAFGTQMDV